MWVNGRFQTDYGLIGNVCLGIKSRYFCEAKAVSSFCEILILILNQ